MFIRGYSFFLLLLYFPISGIGQETKLLILEKTGTRHRITYTIGDHIILKLKGEDYEIHEEIKNISEGVIYLGDFFIPVEAILYVKTVHTKGFLSPSNGPKLIIAGVALFAFDFLNQTLIQGDDYEYSKGIGIASASLVGLGGVLMSFKYRKFRPGKRKRIRTFIY
jgi:hypothetical protein